MPRRPPPPATLPSTCTPPEPTTPPAYPAPAPAHQPTWHVSASRHHQAHAGRQPARNLARASLLSPDPVRHQARARPGRVAQPASPIPSRRQLASDTDDPIVFSADWPPAPALPSPVPSRQSVRPLRDPGLALAVGRTAGRAAVAL